MLDPYDKKSSNLDNLLQQFGRSIGQLDDDSKRLGTAQDSADFRKNVQDKMQRASTMMKNLQVELEDFKNFDVSYDRRTIRDQKYDALCQSY